jgi:hypothetical protein
MNMKCSALLIGLMLSSGLAQAQVMLDGEVEYGLFTTSYQDFAPGERILAQRDQPMERTTEVPARLGSKFGMRYSLTGKTSSEAPLTLLYLTPGVITPDGVRHDKFVVTQALAVDAVRETMAFEFTEAHEVVPGEWHFLVFQNDRKIAEQRFIVR